MSRAILPSSHGPPQIDDVPRRGRRRLVGQGLAGQEPHRLGHRAFGALGDALEALAAILLVEHRRQIVRRPRPCAARPAPRPAPAPAPRTPSAPAGCRAAAWRAPRRRDSAAASARLSAAPRNCAASSAGRSRAGLGSLTRLPLRPGGSGPKPIVRSSRSAIARSVDGGRPLEDFGRREILRHDVGSQSCYISVALTPVSGSSVPKQRW